MNNESNPNEESSDSQQPYLATLLDSELQTGFNRTRWNVYLSWAAILLTTLGMFVLVFTVNKLESEDTEASQAEMMAINSQAKSLVGFKEFFEAPVGSQVDDLNVGSLEQRYGIVLLKNDLMGAEAAEELLKNVDEVVKEQNYEPTKTQQRLRTTVGQLLAEYKKEQWDSSTITQDDREFLTKQLGWVGELGLTPSESPNLSGRKELLAKAKKSAIAGLTIFCLFGLIGFVGICSAITMSVLLFSRKLTSFLPDRRTRSVVYLETFAIWIVLFFVVSQVGAAFVLKTLNINGGAGRLFFQLCIFFGSLFVLVWPRLRGLTFRQIREDIGWTCSNPFKEIACGAFAYAAMAPFIGAFMIVMVIILSLTMQADPNNLAPTGGASHPIQDQIATGNFIDWLGVVLMAVVAAPIVEETMFRGVFYRYLKDSTNRQKFVVSVLLACLINGLIFAALHPQGLIGIPFLTLLAVGMSLARQWRDSLVASITMHGINNGLITCLMFAIF